MKQSMKRIWFMLCMAACFFSISACSAAKSDPKAEDDINSAYFMQSAKELVSIVTLMSDEELEEGIATAERNKEFVYSEGFTAWKNAKRDTGAVLEVLSANVETVEAGSACTVTLKCEKRNMDFKVIFSVTRATGELSIVSMSFTPEYTLAENMTRALMNTLMGMGTVFGLLIFIIAVISCFKFIRIFEEKFGAGKKVEAEISAPVIMPETAEPIVLEEENPMDDFELTAVITAAIMASVKEPTDGLVVRSIKRAPDAKWKKAY